jgi:activator of 2-hydroxyglutaryl-CoA dehydratase
MVMFFYSLYVLNGSVLMEKARAEKANNDEAQGLEKDRPMDETEAIADVWKRMDELSEMLAHERGQRKRLQEKIEQNVK